MPYMGKHFWLWMALVAALVAALWFVWQVEFTGTRASRQTPTKAQQEELMARAQHLLRQQQEPEKLKQQGRALAEKIRANADFVIHDAAFYGRSTAGQNWRVDAQKAVQPKGEKLIYLQELVARVTEGKGEGVAEGEGSEEDVALQAKTGLLDDTQDVLLLKDGFTGTIHGHKTQGEEAIYQLKKQQAEGRVLEVLGEALALEAQRFKAHIDAEKASFDGGVRLRANLREVEQSGDQE